MLAMCDDKNETYNYLVMCLGSALPLSGVDLCSCL